MTQFHFRPHIFFRFIGGCSWQRSHTAKKWTPWQGRQTDLNFLVEMWFWKETLTNLKPIAERFSRWNKWKKHSTFTIPSVVSIIATTKISFAILHVNKSHGNISSSAKPVSSKAAMKKHRRHQKRTTTKHDIKKLAQVVSPTAKRFNNPFYPNASPFQLPWWGCV